eukprot:Gb_37409 [translate_table: standard]
MHGRVILAAVDDSQESMYALEWALNNFINGAMQDRLILVHAQRNPATYVYASSTGFTVPGKVLDTLEKDAKNMTKKVFARATKVCKAKNVTPETKVYIGDARDVLCNAVKNHSPDMLVVGSHGYGYFKRALLGSVSDYCAHHAQCPVIIVKPCNSKSR